MSRVLVSVLSALAALAQAPALAQPLDAALCQAVVGRNPDYGPNLATAPAGSPRPLRKVELTGPDAVCNDGSPAVMYVRPAPAGSPHADKWVVFFDGGGSCEDPEACLARFCSLGPSPRVFDVAGKMSSLGTPPAVDPRHGILSRKASNRFSAFNQVLVHYCSSDTWLGSAPPKTETASAGAVSFSYDIQFQGEAIVRDVFATLRSGPTVPNGGGLEEAVPDLDQASLVVLAHESAGNGLRMHADRLAAELAPQGTELLDVSDAGFGPALWDPAINWAASGYADYDDLGQQLTVPRFRTFWEVDDSALDASCLASGVDDWYCLDNLYVLLEELSTPFFARADLSDLIARERYFDWGMFTTLFDYASADAAQFGLLPAGSGFLGVNCGGHVAIQTRGFSRTKVRGGTNRSFHDLLWNWVTGAAPTSDLELDANGVAPYDRSRRCS